MNDNDKCAHGACVCAVQEDEEYCSPQCAAAGAQDVTEIACDCGHPDCG